MLARAGPLGESTMRAIAYPGGAAASNLTAERVEVPPEGAKRRGDTCIGASFWLAELPASC